MCFIHQFQYRKCKCLYDLEKPVRCALAREQSRDCAEPTRTRLSSADKNGECPDCEQANKGRDMKEGLDASGYLSTQTFVDRVQHVHRTVSHLHIGADDWTAIRAVLIDFYRTRRGPTEKLYLEGLVTLMGFDVGPDELERENLLRIASERKRQCLDG